MAKTATYALIEARTLTTSTASVTFSSIPGTYTDLVLVTSLRNVAGTSGDQSLDLEVNGDTATNYSFTQLYGNGTLASSNRVSSTTDYSSAGRVADGGTASGTFSVNITNLLDYSNATTYKTFISRQNTAGNYVVISAGLWRSTSAITSIKLTDNSGSNFASGSTFKLYGIQAGSN